MQTDTILQVFSPYIQRKVAQLSEELGKTLDFRQFEKSVMELMKQLEASLIVSVLEAYLADPDFLAKLKVFGGKLGMRFKEYRTVGVRLGNGLELAIRIRLLHLKN